MEELLHWVGLSARFIVGGVLVIGGVQKLRNIAGFGTTLQAYRWLPPRSRRLGAVSLPLAESVLGIALLSGVHLSATTALAVGLFISLAAAFGFTFGLNGRADCGCFGPGRIAQTRQVLARNASLAVLAVIAWAAVGLEVTAGTVLLLSFACLASLVVFTVTLTPEAQKVDSHVTSEGRRRFLRLAGGAAAGLAAVVVLGPLHRTPAAEAACLGCGTCGTDYIFLYCTAPCCGAYVVKKWNHCQTYCYECSQTVNVYCGVPVCC